MLIKIILSLIGIMVIAGVLITLITAILGYCCGRYYEDPISLLFDHFEDFGRKHAERDDEDKR